MLTREQHLAQARERALFFARFDLVRAVRSVVDALMAHPETNDKDKYGTGFCCAVLDAEMGNRDDVIAWIEGIR